MIIESSMNLSDLRMHTSGSQSIPRHSRPINGNTKAFLQTMSLTSIRLTRLQHKILAGSIETLHKVDTCTSFRDFCLQPILCIGIIPTSMQLMILLSGNTEPLKEGLFTYREIFDTHLTIFPSKISHLDLLVASRLLLLLMFVVFFVTVYSNNC